eukprot:354234-Chlamydomonas_euryale.AAC.1
MPQPLPDMCVPRSALAAAALGGWVYAIGGQTSKSTQRSVEVFDTCAERWLTLSAGMGSERKYTSAGVIANRLYVTGGVDEARTKLSSIEAMDPREGRWRCAASGRVRCGRGEQGRVWVGCGEAPKRGRVEGMAMGVWRLAFWHDNGRRAPGFLA